MQREAQEAAAAAELPAARGALAKVLAKEEASVLEACAEWDRNWSGPSSAPSRSVVAAFGRLSAEARGAMADVLAAEYNYHYHFGSCRRQGVRERRRGGVAWAEGGSGLRRGEVVVVEGWAGDRCWEREGWRDEVRAGRLLLLSEDLEPLLRNGGWGGVSRPTGHRRGRRAGGGGGDEGERDGDGLFGEHHGARGFDCPPDWLGVRRRLR